MLLRHIQEEEQKHFEECLKQVENKRTHEYNHNQSRDWIIPDPSSLDRYNDQRPEKHGCDERFENPNLTGFFQGQANLNTGRVAGYYYNTFAGVAFEDLLTNQSLEDETSLLNQRILNYDQIPP